MRDADINPKKSQRLLRKSEGIWYKYAGRKASKAEEIFI